jgi:hypothetical protein
MITMAWVNNAKGTVRSTARGRRLRASPAPVMFLASLKATSMARRLAYRVMIWAAGAVVSVVTRARTGRPGSATTITRTGRDRYAPSHRQRRSRTVTRAVLP